MTRLLSGSTCASLAALAILALLSAPGCRRADTAAPVKEGVATLRVTREFQEVIVPAVEFSCDGKSVMAALHQHAQLETAHGGGFVQALNGVEASIDGGKNRDWFYFVNGVLAHVGGKAYQPVSGDRIWWDYREWSENRTLGAVIGDFPQPFVGGYAGSVLPTVIVHTAKLEEQAQQIRKTLLDAGVREVSLLPFSENLDIETKGSLYLIAGPWNDLREHAFINEMHNNGNRTGLFFQFTETGMLELLDTYGKTRSTLEKGSVIAAARLGTGKDLPIWLVTGTGDDAVREACELLGNAGAVSGYAALAISKTGMQRLPHVD